MYPREALAVEPGTPMIVARDLAKTYPGGVQAVKGISFDVYAGEVFGGPSAGLVILDSLAHHPQLSRWPQLEIARVDLLTRLGRTSDAITAYRRALELEPPTAERLFIAKKIRDLRGKDTSSH